MSSAIQTAASADWRVQFKYAGTWWNFGSGFTHFSDAFAALPLAPREIAGQTVEQRIVKTFD